MFRRDSFNDSGSDSEFDEPFFNFDSEECDAEEQYAEALRDELKKLQVGTKLKGQTRVPATFAIVFSFVQPVNVFRGRNCHQNASSQEH